MQTSISDTELYRQSCRLAATDPELFSVFRQLDYITDIIEPWRTAGGDVQMTVFAREVLEQLRQESDFAEDWARCVPNDAVGAPRLLTLNGLGQVSPYTLRYLKVAYDLRTLFGSLDGLDIVELGGGFGGQCAVLSRLFKWRSYTLVDLPETLMLAERYLTQLNIDRVRFVTDDSDVGRQRVGLFLSNYAYTELNAALRHRYRDTFLAAADRGFLLWNLRYFETQRAAGDVVRGQAVNDAEIAQLFSKVQNGRFADHLLQSNDHYYGNQLVIWGG